MSRGSFVWGLQPRLADLYAAALVLVESKLKTDDVLDAEVSVSDLESADGGSEVGFA